MDNKKLSPLQVVAREMSVHSTLTRGQIESSLSTVLGHLMLRAEVAIRSDARDALDFAQQYQAVSEAILFLGSQLIAFEDIEVDDDPDDDWDPKN